jgi:heme-degrading monooxygenase HmoA
MFARVEMFKADPDQMDERLTEQHHAVGRVRTMAGNMGGYVLVNRDRGELLNVTFWQSEDERRSAEVEFGASAARGEVVEYAIAMQEALTT